MKVQLVKLGFTWPQVLQVVETAPPRALEVSFPVTEFPAKRQLTNSGLLSPMDTAPPHFGAWFPMKRQLIK